MDKLGDSGSPPGDWEPLFASDGDFGAPSGGLAVGGAFLWEEQHPAFLWEVKNHAPNWHRPREWANFKHFRTIWTERMVFACSRIKNRVARLGGLLAGNLMWNPKQNGLWNMIFRAEIAIVGFHIAFARVNASNMKRWSMGRYATGPRWSSYCSTVPLSTDLITFSSFHLTISI